MIKNGLIIAPISIEDVKTTLPSSGNDVGYLCKHRKVNMWSKHKPVKLSSIEPDRSTQWWKSENLNCGIVPYRSSKDFSEMAQESFSTIRAIIDNENDVENGWIYEKPEGGATEPFRLADFNEYWHNAKPKYSNLHVVSFGKWGTSVQVQLTTDIQSNGSRYEVSYQDIEGGINKYHFERIWQMLIWKNMSETLYTWQWSSANGSPLVKAGSIATIGSSLLPLSTGATYDVYAIMCIPEEDTGNEAPTPEQIALSKFYTFPRVAKLSFVMQSSLTCTITAYQQGDFARITISVTNTSTVEQVLNNVNCVMIRESANKDDYISPVSGKEKLEDFETINILAGATVKLWDDMTILMSQLPQNPWVLVQLDNAAFRKNKQIRTISET